MTAMVQAPPTDQITTGVEVVVTGAIGRLVLNNPPLNLITRPMRQALLDGIRDHSEETTVEVIVLQSKARVFSAGADIREFPLSPKATSDDGPEEKPRLRDVVWALLEANKPTVAFLDGDALGGGFELALACSFRVATPKARIGLPEVQLGLLPGSGGTQLLSRRAGAAFAADVILSGRRVAAEEACAAGAVDAVVADADGLEGWLASRPNGSDVTVSGKAAGHGFDAPLLYRRSHEAPPGFWAPLKAIDSIRAATRHDLIHGMDVEWRNWLWLYRSPQCEGSFHAFFNARRFEGSRVTGGDPSAVVEGDSDGELTLRFRDGSRRLAVWEGAGAADQTGADGVLHVFDIGDGQRLYELSGMAADDPAANALIGVLRSQGHFAVRGLADTRSVARALRTVLEECDPDELAALRRLGFTRPGIALATDAFDAESVAAQALVPGTTVTGPLKRYLDRARDFAGALDDAAIDYLAVKAGGFPAFMGGPLFFTRLVTAQRS